MCTADVGKHEKNSGCQGGLAILSVEPVARSYGKKEKKKKKVRKTVEQLKH